MTVTDEDWEHIKLGRFDDADEQLVQRVMGRRFMRRLKYGKKTASSRHPTHVSNTRSASSLRVQERTSRSNVLMWQYEHVQSREAVVKTGFCTKSKQQAVDQLKYIARLRKRDRQHPSDITLFNEFGEPLAPETAFLALRDWRLSDKEKPSAPAAIQTTCPRAYNQTWHFVLSIEDDLKEDEELSRFQAAVHATVDEAFTASGHKALWCIHSGHTKHSHAHLMIKALSDLGKRIHCDINGDYLLALRVVFAKHLRRAGFEYDATRRVDRTRLRDKIMSGESALKNHYRHWQDKPVSEICLEAIGSPMAAGMEQLEQMRSAVRNSVSHESIGQSAHLIREAFSPKPTLLGMLKSRLHFKQAAEKQKYVPREYLALFEAIHPMYLDPHQALVAWHRLATHEQPYDQRAPGNCTLHRLADWVICHRPEWLGRIKMEAFETQTIDRLRKTLRHQQVLPTLRTRPAPKLDNTISHALKLKRVHKDRKSVIAELNRMAERIETEGHNTLRAKAIRSIAQQASCIPIQESHSPSTSGITPGQLQPVLPTKKRNVEDERPLKQNVISHVPEKVSPIMRSRPIKRPRLGIER